MIERIDKTAMLTLLASTALSLQAAIHAAEAYASVLPITPVGAAIAISGWLLATFIPCAAIWAS